MQTLPLNVVPPGLELEVSPVGSVPVVGVSVAGVSVDGVSLDGVSVGSSVVGLSEHAPVEYKHIHVGKTPVYMHPPFRCTSLYTHSPSIYIVL